MALLSGLFALCCVAMLDSVAVAQGSDSTDEVAPGNTGMAFSFIQRSYTLAPGEGPGHKVLVVYAIPVMRLDATPDASVIPARVRLSHVRTPEDTVVLTDSVRQLVPMLAAGPGYALGYQELTFTAGSHNLRLYLGTSDARIGLEAGLPPIVVEDLRHQPLWLSDLVLGRTGRGLTWERDGETVWIDPLNTYRQAEAIEVYYEVVGLPEGASFDTSITLTPVLAYNPVEEEHLDPVVSFGYEEVARSRFTALRRTLSLGDFPPGRYRLSVAARSGQGVLVERSTIIRVLRR